MSRAIKTEATNRVLACVVVTACLAAATAHALINPSFTPIHLVKDSSLIVGLTLEAGPNSVFTATVRQTLKGKPEKQTLVLDASGADEESVRALAGLAAAGQQALLFEGRFRDQGNPTAFRRAYLSIGGKWARCDAGDGGWVLTSLGDREMAAVWAGGTDMLGRAVRYIIEDEDPAVPVSEGMAWDAKPVRIGALTGSIRAIRPLNLGSGGRPVLFVACDAGDRLLEMAETRAVTDVGAARGLRSKSLAYAWGNFAGEGRLDLASFDGMSMTLHAQQADGTFRAQPLELGPGTTKGCIGLAAVDVGSGRAGLVVSGSGFPVVAARGDDGRPVVTALAAPGVDPATLGTPGPCLVADFDGDGFADILLPAASASVFFRGTGKGGFAAGRPCDLHLGKGPATACLCDFDADGLLDVFCVNAEGSLLWDNAGSGTFKERFEFTGELAYGAGKRGVDCMTGDFNNDGRQDVMIAYGSGHPMLFFNRGFRTFGNATGINLDWEKLLPEAAQGQVAACLADLDRDGGQDLIVALKNGAIWTVFQERGTETHQTMMAEAVLPAGGGCAGPVVVKGRIGTRSLGAWNVLPGVGQGQFGRTEAGVVTLTWRLPGGPEQSREVILERDGVLSVPIK